MAKKIIETNHEFFNDEEAQVYVFLHENADEGGFRVSQTETVTVNGISYSAAGINL